MGAILSLVSNEGSHRNLVSLPTLLGRAKHSLESREGSHRKLVHLPTLLPQARNNDAAGSDEFLSVFWGDSCSKTPILDPIF